MSGPKTFGIKLGMLDSDSFMYTHKASDMKIVTGTAGTPAEP